MADLLMSIYANVLWLYGGGDWFPTLGSGVCPYCQEQTNVHLPYKGRLPSDGYLYECIAENLNRA